jgi:hypothetical protein
MAKAGILSLHRTAPLDWEIMGGGVERGTFLSIIGYFKASLVSAHALFICSLRKNNNQGFRK